MFPFPRSGGPAPNPNSSNPTRGDRRFAGGVVGDRGSPAPPAALGQVLADLFAGRGYARMRGTEDLRAAWAAALGAAGDSTPRSGAGAEARAHAQLLVRRTRVDALKRGVLTITVAHPVLLEELAAYRKPALLEFLRRMSPDNPIHDIRFRLGRVEEEAEGEAEAEGGGGAIPPRVSNAGPDVGIGR